jgi:23S rRNA (adenine2503-C2)-methyltransferase
MSDSLSLLPEEWETIMRRRGEPRYRAKQLFSALHNNLPLHTLPKALRDEYRCTPYEVLKRQVSADSTVKLLYALDDGEKVESVLLDYQNEVTICVSTQVGCRQGCTFCASTIGGLTRNLTAGEMMGQVLCCGAVPQRVVLMGMGEPLDNFDNTVRFLELLSHPWGRNMSCRNITVSTCGLPPQILRLAALHLPVTLSISLHAPDDKTRSAIMPINRKYGIAELMLSAKIYFDKTGRRNSYEYAMINGVNDSAAKARELCGLLAGQRAHVNLIPLNKVRGTTFVPSRRGVIEAFAAELTAGGVNVTIRRRLGADISAACGQLRRNNEGDSTV